MKTVRSILALAMAVATLSLAAISPAQSQAQLCMTNSAIQDAIKAGQIKSWPKIKQLAGISAYEEVSNVQVCIEDGTPYYYVNVVSPSGEATKIVVNAIDGSL